MALTALTRATEALLHLRRGVLLAMDERELGERYQVDLEVLRRWVGLIDWGLGTGPSPSPWSVWVGQLRPEILMRRIDAAVDRINGVAARLLDGEDDVPLGWLSAELEALQLVVNVAARRLSDARRYFEAAGLEREFNWFRGQLLTMLLTKIEGRVQ